MDDLDDLQHLPEIDWDAGGPKPAQELGWAKYDDGQVALGALASSLVVPETNTRPEQMKSVPSPWGRLLLFEHALLKKGHRARADLVDEWRGLLGLIALSDVLGVQIEARGVDLTDAEGAWAEIAPTLLRLTPQGMEEDPRWVRFGLIKANGKVIGGLSPRTLVFTGIESIDLIVPFVRNVGEGAVQRRLMDPVAYYKGQGNAMPIRLLHGWIESRRKALLKNSTLSGYLNDTGVRRAGVVLTLFTEWAASAIEALADLGEEPIALKADAFSESSLATAFPEEHPGYPAAKLLRPISISGLKTS